MEASWWDTGYWLSASAMVADKAFCLSGFVVVASADGGQATLYAQQSAESPSSLGTYRALQNSPTVVMFSRPIWLDRGLYVAVESACHGVLIVGRPAPAK